MALPPGARLGAYEVISPLGAGGMGEVFRARDARLGRDVAIKILPESVARDPDRLARFEREAQAVASLSHPNIVAVFEFGQQPSAAGPPQPFVVMELLDGETLRERLGGGALPVRKALDIATQLARGLAAAHDKNLLHRDLKPENIFLLADGQVKILDFGLARAIDTPAAGSGATQTIARTDPGTVLGTVGYMAPEQVRGGAVDARTDLFALGAVLYEMLTGARAFHRDTHAETLTAILREDPPEASRARQDLPAAIDRIVQHALEKNPAERFQTARDVIFALTTLSGSQAAGSSGSQVLGSSGSQVRESSGSPAVRLATVAVVVAALAGAVGWFLGQQTRSTASTAPRFDQFTQLTDEGGAETMPRISPDGNSFAFVKRVGNSDDIFVQRTGGRQPLAVAADPNRDEHWPAFSPDGRYIAFNEADEDGGIFIIGATGESERRLSDAGFNPAWSPDGKTIAFSAEGVLNPYVRNAEAALYVIDVAGGAPRVIQPVLGGKQDCVQPAWSPDGRRIACWQAIGGQRDLVTMAPDGSNRVVLLNDAPVDYAPVWAPGGTHLYFASDRGGTVGLWRVPMAGAGNAVAGGPEAVSINVEAAMDLPSLSADGATMVFRSRLESVNPAMAPFDPATERAGVPKLLTTRTGILSPSSVSPDGQWLALANQGDIKEDLFVMKVVGSGLRRLTDDLARDRQPRWAPDGKSIVFYSNREGGRYAVYSLRPDGSGLTRLTPPSGSDYYYGAVSPADGTLVVNNGIYESFFVTPPFPAQPQQVRPIKEGVEGGGTLQLSTWSPDGRFVAGGLISKASASAIGVGVYDVNARRAFRLTEDRGLWSVAFLPDSRRLAYITAENELVVVDIATRQRRVIPIAFGSDVSTESFAVAPDGKTVFFGASRVEANVWKVAAR